MQKSDALLQFHKFFIVNSLCLILLYLNCVAFLVVFHLYLLPYCCFITFYNTTSVNGSSWISSSLSFSSSSTSSHNFFQGQSVSIYILFILFFFLEKQLSVLTSKFHFTKSSLLKCNAQKCVLLPKPAVIQSHRQD